MAWIRIEESTPSKPEIARLAMALGCSLGDAFLEFVRLYLWADGNIACPGFVPDISLEMLGNIARVRAGVCECLASASVGWLIVADDGIQFSNWERHNGKSAKQRLYERERKQTYRDSSGQNSDKVRDKVRDKKRPREEKRREEKNLLSKESNKEGKRFIEPTLQEVSEYVRGRGNSVDPDQFMNFYASKGWMIGKNKMKDWQAAVRTWEKNPRTAVPEQTMEEKLRESDERRRLKALAKLAQ